MEKIKVLTVFGTRPEAIKMAPLVKELEKCNKVESKICVTAQHREMLDQVMELFNIVPQYDLDIMKSRQSLTGITNRVLKGLEEVFNEYKPHIVLVHGDTTTTFAAALSAFYHKVKVGHVEAGLRTYNKYLPYPEEMNRKLTASISDMNFAPTVSAKENLLKEGVAEQSIYVTGNTVIDAMETTVEDNYRFENEVLNTIDYNNKKVIMVTAHRRENWGQGIENICKALKHIVHTNLDVEIVYLVHLNPIVKDVVNKYLKNIDRVHLLEPLDTKETHNLMNKSYMIMTDSGGLQEEAPHLGKPVLVLRDVTERPEGVEAGTVNLVGTNYNNIIFNAQKLLENKREYESMSNAINPYGDGLASKRIVNSILYYFGVTDTKPREYK